MVLSAGGYQVICFADGAALLCGRADADARLHPARRAYSRQIRPRHPEGTARRGLSRADLHDLRARATSPWRSARSRMARWISSKSRSAAARSWRGSTRRSRPMHAGRRRTPPRESPSLHFPGREPLTRREREVLRAIHLRRLQQGSRTPTRHQPAHHRGSSRQHHEEARRPQRGRSRADRDDGVAPRVISAVMPVAICVG